MTTWLVLPGQSAPIHCAPVSGTARARFLLRKRSWCRSARISSRSRRSAETMPGSLLAPLPSAISPGKPRIPARFSRIRWATRHSMFCTRMVPSDQPGPLFFFFFLVFMTRRLNHWLTGDLGPYYLGNPLLAPQLHWSSLPSSFLVDLLAFAAVPRSRI